MELNYCMWVGCVGPGQWSRSILESILSCDIHSSMEQKRYFKKCVDGFVPIQCANIIYNNRNLVFLRRKEVTKVWNCWESVTHSWGRRKPVTHAGSPARNVSTSWQPLAGGRSSNTLQVADWVEQVFWSAGVAQKSLKGQLKSRHSQRFCSWVGVPPLCASWACTDHTGCMATTVPSVGKHRKCVAISTILHGCGRLSDIYCNFCWWGLFSYIKPCLPNSLLRIALGRCIHYALFGAQGQCNLIISSEQRVLGAGHISWLNSQCAHGQHSEERSPG